MSNTSATLQYVASVDDFLNVAATETVPLFEYLGLLHNSVKHVEDEAVKKAV